MLIVVVCVFLCVHDMTIHGIQFATKEEDSYRGRVYNLSQAPHVLGLIVRNFNEAQLGAFTASWFGHLERVDELPFSGEFV